MKGQSSIEFSLLVTFMFLMFTVFFVVASDRLAEINRENDIKQLLGFNRLYGWECWFYYADVGNLLIIHGIGYPGFFHMLDIELIVFFV